MTKRYYGLPVRAPDGRGYVVRVADDRGLTKQLPLRTGLLRQSDGFEWGAAMPAAAAHASGKTAVGPGASQLAFAILMDALDDETRARKLYQRFKHRTLATYDQDKAWSMSIDDVLAHVAEIERVEIETAPTRRQVAGERGPVAFEGGPEIVWDTDDDGKQVRR